MPFSSIEAALVSFKSGNFLIVIDSPGRENEGDLIISCSHLTPSKMAFMVRHTSGLICVPMSSHRLEELELPDMIPTQRNQEAHGTAFTVSCDLKEGVHTGISATDRTRTCLALASRLTKAGDLTRPGHLFPLRARPNGVLERAGHTEAAVDLCNLTQQPACAAICEIVRSEDGEMARTEELLRLGLEWGILVITIEDLVAYRNLKNI